MRTASSSSWRRSASATPTSSSPCRRPGSTCATMADLDEVAADLRARHGRKLRVATKYVNLTRRFFAEHGVADYRIVESLGATEGAPATGAAELIVDITTTGATLAANGLKVLDDGVILRSEANLVASLKRPLGRAGEERGRRRAGPHRRRGGGAHDARDPRHHRRTAAATSTRSPRVSRRARPPGRSDGGELVLHCPATRSSRSSTSSLRAAPGRHRAHPRLRVPHDQSSRRASVRASRVKRARMPVALPPPHLWSGRFTPKHHATRGWHLSGHPRSAAWNAQHGWNQAR